MTATAELNGIKIYFDDEEMEWRKEEPDNGKPPPGSDPTRRQRIKRLINKHKQYNMEVK
jgi:hypothetical protein